MAVTTCTLYLLQNQKVQNIQFCHLENYANVTSLYSHPKSQTLKLLKQDVKFYDPVFAINLSTVSLVLIQYHILSLVMFATSPTVIKTIDAEKVQKDYCITLTSVFLVGAAVSSKSNTYRSSIYMEPNHIRTQKSFYFALLCTCISIHITARTSYMGRVSMIHRSA